SRGACRVPPAGVASRRHPGNNGQKPGGNPMRSLEKTSFILLACLALLGPDLLPAQPRGPQPAPVPAAVVMPRPSEAEVEQARAALATFLAGLDGDARRVFNAYPYLLEVR